MKRTPLPLAPLAAVTLVGACGDPMLPSDFAGPPLGAISGTVSPGTSGEPRDALRPRLSLEWLAPFEDTRSLIGQPVSYQRSKKLQSDWDIGLGLPAPGARFDAHAGSQSVRIAVSKMVYFDDHNGDGRLDWSCRVLPCDTVKAVSAQFVLFVETPPYCQPRADLPPQPRLGAGYHYFMYADDGVIREVSAAEPLEFTLTDRSLPDSDPTAALHTFTNQLLRSWSIASLSGC